MHLSSFKQMKNGHEYFSIFVKNLISGVQSSRALQELQMNEFMSLKVATQKRT